MTLPTLGWLGLPLPLPEESSYGYTRDHGLLRTSTTTPQPRQRRIRTSRPRQFSVSVILTQAELQIAESALQADGYSWFVMPLISGRDVGITEHKVRLIEPWSVSCVDWDRYEMTMKLEEDYNRSCDLEIRLYAKISEYIDITEEAMENGRWWMVSYMMYGDLYAAARSTKTGMWVPAASVSSTVQMSGQYPWVSEPVSMDLGNGIQGFRSVGTEDLWTDASGAITIIANVGSCSSSFEIEYDTGY